jgi:hypothetical protein
MAIEKKQLTTMMEEFHIHGKYINDIDRLFPPKDLNSAAINLAFFNDKTSGLERFEHFYKKLMNENFNAERIIDFALTEPAFKEVLIEIWDHKDIAKDKINRVMMPYEQRKKEHQKSLYLKIMQSNFDMTAFYKLHEQCIDSIYREKLFYYDNRLQLIADELHNNHSLKEEIAEKMSKKTAAILEQAAVVAYFQQESSLFYEKNMLDESYFYHFKRMCQKDSLEHSILCFIKQEPLGLFSEAIKGLLKTTLTSITGKQKQADLEVESLISTEFELDCESNKQFKL